MLKPIFIAHRGYASEFPENSLLAIDAAFKAGATIIEVDIQLSADSIPVLFHDRDLQRLCQQPGAIHDYSWAQLEQFNVSNYEKFAEKFVDNKMTSLQQFILYLKKHPDLKSFIELKRVMINTFSEEHVLEVLLPLFESMEQQITFISFNHQILKKIHTTTHFSTGIIIDNWNELIKDPDWHSEWILCDITGLPENNDELNRQEKIAVYEVGNIGLAKHLLSKGIQYLETFRIKEMFQAFSK